MIPYWAALILISFVFFILERLWPRRQQKTVRPQFGSDLMYLAFNGHFLALILAPVIGLLAPRTDHVLVPLIGHEQVANWPLWSQFLLAFFLVDFLQWVTHVLMHRVPFLWHFHRVHHSIEDMDWLGNMRLHWFEIVVYRSLLYAPLFWLGFHGTVLVTLAIFSTAMGHFNHANVRINLGLLRYFFNNPDMHIWHHEVGRQGRAACNFGINLSLWDWIFGTAYEPKDKRRPKALGFYGLVNFPRGFFAQQAVPFGGKKKSTEPDRQINPS